MSEEKPETVDLTDDQSSRETRSFDLDDAVARIEALEAENAELRSRLTSIEEAINKEQKTMVHHLLKDRFRTKRV